MKIRRIMGLALLGVALFASAATAGDTHYTYDALGRVVQVAYPDGTVISYSYDKAGNRVSTVVTASAGSKWGSFTWGQGRW